MSKTYRISVMDYEAMDPTSRVDRIRKIKSFAPARCGSNFTNVLNTSCENGYYVWVPQDPTDVKSLRPRQNGRRFADDTFKRIFLNEIVWISIKISLKFVPRVPINNIPALVQIMAWRRPGGKPLSEPLNQWWLV